MSPLPLHLAVEDDLSETVLRRLLRERPVEYAIGAVFKHGGSGYLKKHAPAFNNMAKANPVLLLTDLDQRPCPPELIADWLRQRRHPEFLLRVAVREVEAWLLASDAPLAQYLSTRQVSTFPAPEDLEDPKMELLKLAEGSTKRNIREAVTRRDTGGNLRQGPAYNSTLAKFVNQFWKPEHGVARCPSLQRAIKALERLEFQWQNRCS